jgi:hypothetical protein
MTLINKLLDLLVHSFCEGTATHTTENANGIS